MGLPYIGAGAGEVTHGVPSRIRATFKAEQNGTGRACSSQRHC